MLFLRLRSDKVKCIVNTNYAIRPTGTVITYARIIHRVISVTYFLLFFSLFTTLIDSRFYLINNPILSVNAHIPYYVEFYLQDYVLYDSNLNQLNEITTESQ